MGINIIPFDKNSFDPKNPVAGIYSGMPIRFYHGPEMRHILSKSTIVKARSCPANMRIPDEDSPDKKLGRAADPYILEGEEAFNREFVVMPDFPDTRPKKSKGWHNTDEYRSLVADFQLNNMGKELVTREQFETIKCMKSAVLMNPKGRLILSASNMQLTYIWQDTDVVFPDGMIIPGTGMWLKSRPDMTCLQSDDLFDLKSDKNISHHSFQGSMIKWGYDIQVGMAFEAFWRLTGRIPKNFTMLVVQKDLPFQCEAWPLIKDDEVDAPMSGKWIIGGIAQFHRLLRLIALCEKENFWPNFKPEYKNGKWDIFESRFDPLLTPGYYHEGEQLWEETWDE